MSLVIEQRVLDRLLRLPAGGDVWQLRAVPVSGWLDPPAEPEDAFDVFVAVSGDQRVVGMSDSVRAGAPRVPAAFAALLSLSGAMRPPGRPACVQVDDPELHAMFASTLAECGVTCECVEHTFLLDEPVEEMARDVTGLEPHPQLYAAYSTPQLLALADALAQFLARRPWVWLDSADFIWVEAPVREELPRYFSVQGGVGVHRGLHFMSTNADMLLAYSGTLTDEEQSELESWGCSAAAPVELSTADLQRWIRDRLPPVNGRDLPCLSWHTYEEGCRPVAVADASYFEAMLRAMALTSEDDLDAMRWEKTVRTHDGEVTVRLSLPQVQAAEESSESARGETPQERAAAWMAQVEEFEGRRCIQLARRALREWPDAVDAHIELGLWTSDPAEALECFARGIEAGERVLGPAVLAEHRGRYWSEPGTRSYLRARAGYAEALLDLRRTDEGLACSLELLELDTADALDVRFDLVPRLLAEARLDETRGVLERFPEDRDPLFLWARALVLFGEAGDTPEAREAASVARRANPYVLKYLVGSPLPAENTATELRPGSEAEAQDVAPDLLSGIDAIDGAVLWLRALRLHAKKEGKARRGR